MCSPRRSRATRWARRGWWCPRSPSRRTWAARPAASCQFQTRLWDFVLWLCVDSKNRLWNYVFSFCLDFQTRLWDYVSVPGRRGSPCGRDRWSGACGADLDWRHIRKRPWLKNIKLDKFCGTVKTSGKKQGNFIATDETILFVCGHS